VDVIKVTPDEFPTISILFEAIKNNKPLFGLSKEKIKVTENGESCEIVSLKEISDNYPVNISLIIDHSGSMRIDAAQLYDTLTGKYLLSYEIKDGKLLEKYPEGYVQPIENAKKAVKEFIATINNERDSIQIIDFSTLVDIQSSFSNNKEYLGSWIDSMKADFSTAFLDAINVSLDSIKKHSGIKVIVALSDGMDNSSHVSLENIIKKAKELKIPIYTIGLGNVDIKFLTEISKSTGGAFYYTRNSNSLDIIYREIQKRIQD
jgi:Ca-activated chloride channel family protein